MLRVSDCWVLAITFMPGFIAQSSRSSASVCGLYDAVYLITLNNSCYLIDFVHIYSNLGINFEINIWQFNALFDR